jgi:hypothetical protein
LFWVWRENLNERFEQYINGKRENFHSNFPVRLKKILWEARSTPTLVLPRKIIYSLPLHGHISHLYRPIHKSSSCQKGSKRSAVVGDQQDLNIMHFLIQFIVLFVTAFDQVIKLKLFFYYYNLSKRGTVLRRVFVCLFSRVPQGRVTVYFLTPTPRLHN